MKQSPSWGKPTSFSAGEEMKAKGPYHVHKSPPLVPYHVHKGPPLVPYRVHKGPAGSYPLPDESIPLSPALFPEDKF